MVSICKDITFALQKKTGDSVTPYAEGAPKGLHKERDWLCATPFGIEGTYGGFLSQGALARPHRNQVKEE